MRILIAGVAEWLGRQIAERLLNTPGVAAVIGLDVRACTPPVAGMRFVWVAWDRPEWTALLQGIDAAVYLPGLVDWRRKMPDPVAAVKSFTRAVIAAGVPKLIVPNSALVYGLQKAETISEDAPLRGYQAGEYARRRAFVADYLDGVARRTPALAITEIRTAWVSGPHYPALDQFIQHTPVLVCEWEGKKLQVTYEADLVETLVLAVQQDMAGVYNLSSGAGKPWREMAEDRPCISWAGLMARVWWRWRWFRPGALPPDVVRALYRSPALDTRKLQRKVEG
ncbi:MAG TPA: NAD-dependent epimerase/dehydratase family protein [Aggregatilineaceae bacterium]|nr:NAD-dependent epimerase/dehydratase family protein [Aggregatilineaceae bacterium]